MHSSSETGKAMSDQNRTTQKAGKVRSPQSQTTSPSAEPSAAKPVAVGAVPPAASETNPAPVAKLSGNGAPPPLARAPLAYENPRFLNSADGRLIRIVAEFMEPLARFRRELIQDTVVFFGSARFRGKRKPITSSNCLRTPALRAPRPAKSSRPAHRRSQRARPAICSGSAPLPPWKWPGTTRMRGA